MKTKLKVLLPLLFVIALLAVMSFAVNAEECEHNIIHVEAVPPINCSDGNIEYWYCAECDQYWLDEARTQVTQKEATVIYSGLEHEYMDIGNYYICRYCGEENNFDPSPEKWYTKAVIYCVKNGYMTGVSPERFGHNENVTRAMFTTILAKIDGAEVSSYIEMSFKDVRLGMWYSSYIEWAYQKGYAAGLGDGVFGYKENVTREQLVTFFYTYSAKNGVDVSGRADLAKYSDCDKIHDWARDAMSWAVNVGLVSGTSETTLSPRSFATRAELAVIVMNYVESKAPLFEKFGLTATSECYTEWLLDTYKDGEFAITFERDPANQLELPEITATAKMQLKWYDSYRDKYYSASKEITSELTSLTNGKFVLPETTMQYIGRTGDSYSSTLIIFSEVTFKSSGGTETVLFETEIKETEVSVPIFEKYNLTGSFYLALDLMPGDIHYPSMGIKFERITEEETNFPDMEIDVLVNGFYNCSLVRYTVGEHTDDLYYVIDDFDSYFMRSLYESGELIPHESVPMRVTITINGETEVLDIMCPFDAWY